MDRITEQALSLPADEKLNLVDKLLSSLNLPPAPEIESLWAEEAERRIAEIDSGEAELIPGNVVFEKIRKKYGQ